MLRKTRNTTSSDEEICPTPCRAFLFMWTVTPLLMVSVVEVGEGHRLMQTLDAWDRRACDGTYQHGFPKLVNGPKNARSLPPQMLKHQLGLCAKDNKLLLSRNEELLDENSNLKRQLELLVGLQEVSNLVSWPTISL